MGIWVRCSICNRKRNSKYFDLQRGHVPQYCHDCLDEIDRCGEDIVEILNCHNGNVKNYVKKLKYESGCIICGYKKCTNALEFHHIDATKKDRNVSICKTFHDVIEEMELGVFLCANCHREVHAGLHGDKDLLTFMPGEEKSTMTRPKWNWHYKK